MDHWTITNCVERARERQAALANEAKRQRLLRELADTTERFALFRKTVLVTANLLIAAGVWLKQQATPAQSHAQRPTMAGRFS
ncbi:MAG: hypothetical protein DYG89_42075 [Caldilinea sp. CFX5]|nr:hypothetical protein [Caldilinea sp. CFX5]